MNSFKGRACGILFCYNEEHIIAETLRHYLSQGIDLAVFDNYSTDSSGDIIKGFLNRQGQYAGEIREVIRVKTQGYDWKYILRRANGYMHKNLRRYEWILLIDADAFYFSPVRGLTLLEYMDAVKKYGYNIINGLVCNFYPTEKDDLAITSHIERIRYYRVEDVAPQQKIFLYHPTIKFYTSDGHSCLRGAPRVFMNPPFIYKHYGWVSCEHGLKKIFLERKRRYAEKRLRVNVFYVHMLPLKKDFIRDSQKLAYFDEKKMLVSRRKFPSLNKSVKSLPKKNNKRMPASIDYREYYCWPPAEYHFLMTNYCNARCIFCNQKFDSRVRKAISLDKFKIMLSHIPGEYAEIFYFSGGGEPLLCPDLFAIARQAHTFFPKVKTGIKTNGLLLEKYAQDIARSDINYLEVSVHGLADMNDSLLQIKNSKNIFEGFTLLNEYQKRFNKRIYKNFYIAVSRLNINQVPDLIIMAARLKVRGVKVVFCRYYMHRIGGKLKKEDSLYFHQGLYNRVIKSSIKLAQALKVEFTYEPLFSKKIYANECCQPWSLLLVDWDGDVYPCTGGEARFYEKVKSGEYRFGNLLKEDLYDFWFAETYAKIRRTCMSSYAEKNIPECESCHNALCFKGPNVQSGHILY